MPHADWIKPKRVFAFLAVVLIAKVTAAVIWGYRDYFPANFNSDFLRGREKYFSGGYHWAFYTHIASGPVSLLLGTLLVSDRFRQRLPRWHRVLGRLQVALILLLVVPSGLWMAFYAAAGPVAGLGLAMLAILTATFAVLGLKAAVNHRFAVHRRWMWRTYLLLCSAVVIRLAGGLATVIGVQASWFDPLSSWSSWLVPLVVFESIGHRDGYARRVAAAFNNRQHLPGHSRQ